MTDFSKLALVDPVALAPWGSPFFTLVRDHAEVFQQLPAAIHAAVQPVADALGVFLRANERR